MEARERKEGKRNEKDLFKKGMKMQEAGWWKFPAVETERGRGKQGGHEARIMRRTQRRRRRRQSRNNRKKET
jgi:hypothetical protein